MTIKVDESPEKNKQKYKVTNWAEYNEALVNRGRVTLWFDEDAIEQWYEAEKSGKKGASNLYSDTTILCGLTIRSVFHLPLRATEGFMHSLVDILGLSLKIPDYTTFSRRQQKIEVPLVSLKKKHENIHVVVDSTGLKVFGEGEWKTRKHGVSKRRTWRKLHLAIDEESQEIMMSVLSDNDCGDMEVFKDLLEPLVDEVDKVSGDGAYDTFEIHDFLKEHEIDAIIPPQKNAVEKHKDEDVSPLLRDEHIREIQKIGLAEWKKKHGYHRRSLSETAMYRMKQLFGSYLSNRTIDSQGTEAFVRCNALNIMTSLGMPISVPVN